MKTSKVLTFPTVLSRIVVCTKLYIESFSNSYRNVYCYKFNFNDNFFAQVPAGD